ncbi:cellulase family glycosylhydrolase [Actinomadura atramentaria]|uniref:cellulase family glycosylhydrolase n=1 Tax=Actinomadura atramentaria TaxID=1990 RepID=UPI0003A56331|nr:cellulase family glycosylhydrolase [Actinomadura atramentaria]
MKLGRWVVGGAALAAVLAVVAPARADSGAGVSDVLGHQGRWITDAQGRRVIPHGFNMVAKAPPYDPARLGFGEKDAAFLAEHGFTAVRLGVVLSGLEPSPGEFDDRYLASIEKTVDVLGKHGIRTLLTFPQDLLSTKFRGTGYPDWMIRTDGIPVDFLNHDTFQNLLSNPALQRAEDNFWNNAPVAGKGLQDWYAEAWTHVAKRFRGNPAVLGYDLWNEPWPGSAWPSCLPPFGCGDFDGKKLAPFFTKMIRAIRTVDPGHLAFYEPNLLATVGSPINLGRPGDARSGLSFHAYCVDLSGKETPDWMYRICDGVQKTVFDQAAAQADRTGDALLLSEFGATKNPDEMSYVVRLADERRVPWLEWTYCRCGDPTDGGTVEGLVYDLTKPRSGANVNTAALNVLDEPYPQVVAGTPKSYGYDPDANIFTLTYTPSGGGDTLVYTSPLHHPRGYRVAVRGATVVSAPDAPVLRLRAAPGATEVGVSVSG